MNISGLEKITLTDYPAHVACIIFTQGCNLKCEFCQNSDLVEFTEKSLISEKEFFDYLLFRQNILDGVVISGGEPLLQPKIKEFIKKIKDLGFKVKLDTNGTNADLLKELIDENLLDYVAMDIKTTLDDYGSVSGCEKFGLDNIKKTIKVLTTSGITHEFRTTVTKKHHTYEHLKNICGIIGNNNYYLQNFEDSDRVINKGIPAFTDLELKELVNRLNEQFPNVQVRGL